MGRSSFVQLLVLPLVVATVGFSTVSQARENYCDHSSGKAVGTIVGGLLGAGIGAIADHGHTTGVLLGGAGGAIAGRVLGHEHDNQLDVQDCGVYAESYQRRLRRDEDAQDRAEYRQERRDEDIQDDIARSRDRWDRGDEGGWDRGDRGDGWDRSDRYRRPRYPRRMIFECESLGYTRWGQQFGVVDLRYNTVVESTGQDYGWCQRRADMLNRYRR